MPLYQHLQSDNGECEIAIWQITESEEELVTPLSDGLVLLNEACSRFKATSRRLEWLAVRRLLHETGCTSSIAYHPTGRPYLANDNRHISISHTRGYAAVALHQNLPIGLDIEQRTDKVRRVRDKYISDEEKIFLPSEKNEVEALLVVWTAKEAMFKLVDQVGIDFAEHFHVSAFELLDKGNFKAHETFTTEQLVFDFHYRIYPEFVLSFATEQIAGKMRL